MEQIELKTYPRYAYPRQIMAFEIPTKDEKIVSLHAVLRHEPSSLELIARALRENDVQIKHVSVYERKDTGGLIINAFLDVSKSPGGMSSLQTHLEKLDCLEKLVILENRPVLHQTSLFPIFNRSERVVLHSVKRMQYIRDQLERILTPSGLAVIFYNIGVENGKGTHELFVQQFNANTATPEKRMDIFRDHNISGGVGIYDFTELDLKSHSGIIRLYEDFECDNIKKDRPHCHQARGTLVGFLGAEWPGSRVKVVELKCRAIGDPHCEFAVGE